MSNANSYSVLEYPKVAALERVVPFFEQYKGDIRVEEKIDGSNVGIRFTDDGLLLQSRNTIIDQDNPGMFRPFVDWAQQSYVLGLFKSYNTTDMIYGEMIGNGKIKYKDTPPFLAFDVRRDLPSNEKPNYIPFRYFVNTWLRNVPRAPLLYEGPWQGVEHVQSLLGPSFYSDVQNNAVLMEGVVVKAHNATCWYTRADEEVIKYTEPLLCGKYVRADYKETRAPKKERLESNPLKEIAESMVTQARVDKARQKFDGPTKPHQLIPIVIRDVFDEETGTMKDLLLDVYRKQLSSAIAQAVLACS